MHLNVRALRLYWNLPNYELLSQCGRAHRESIAITLGSGTTMYQSLYSEVHRTQHMPVCRGLTAMQCDAR